MLENSNVSGESGVKVAGSGTQLSWVDFQTQLQCVFPGQSI